LANHPLEIVVVVIYIYICNTLLHKKKNTYIKIQYGKYVFKWSIDNELPKEKYLENPSFKRDGLKHTTHG
jgi:hypothetical protein